MKQIKRLFAALFLISVLSFLAGCGTVPNPAHVSDPNAPAWIPDPRLTNAEAHIAPFVPLAQGALAATPAAPISPLIPGAVALIFGILSGIQQIRVNSANKSASDHSDAANAMASAITTLNSKDIPAVQTALSHAAQNDSVAIVATKLAQAANPVQL